jgi:hypothetical protein
MEAAIDIAVAAWRGRAEVAEARIEAAEARADRADDRAAGAEARADRADHRAEAEHSRANRLEAEIANLRADQERRRRWLRRLTAVVRRKSAP